MRRGGGVIPRLGGRGGGNLVGYDSEIKTKNVNIFPSILELNQFNFATFTKYNYRVCGFSQHSDFAFS